MGFMMRRNTLQLLICLLLPGLFLAGCQQEPPPETEAVVRPVRYIVLEKSGGAESHTFSGVAAAGKDSALSFKVSGTLQKIYVRVGDLVETDQLLAQLDDTDFKVDADGAVANLRSSEANAKGAETNVNTTRSNYARVERLYESGGVSLSEFERAKGDFKTAQAQLQAAYSQITTAQTSLAAAENQLAYTRLKAPFAGVINNIPLEENEVVPSGSQVMAISDLKSPEVKVNLSDLYISKVQPEMPVAIMFPALGKDAAFSGQVTEISYSATDSSTYPVTIRIANPSEALRPGMAASVTFRFSDSQGSDEARILLPSDAVGQDSNGNFVFVISPTDEHQGVVQRRTVQIGPLTPLGFTVEDGLKEGELVATSGLQVLLDEMPVKLMKQK
jgi:RND family efflux transporter MFP subunit